MTQPTSSIVTVNGFRTHYLEQGEGHPLVLLHSGEFGACAELSWELALAPLSEHFRVIAPDWLGFGRSEKVFSFEDMRGLRIAHLAALLDSLGVESAHFVGNSMGGGILAQAALIEPCPLRIDKIILVGAGGGAPANDARSVLDTYDGTIEHMGRIVKTLIRRPDLRDDAAYLERRYELSLEPGGWEATAAPRLKMPGRTAGPKTPLRYEDIAYPTLIIAGAHDPLREPGFGQALHERIVGSELLEFADSGHCPHLDEPGAFAEAAIDFLNEGRCGP